MRKPLRRKAVDRLAGVELCERCGSVCDAGCRARRLRDAQLLQVRVLGHHW